MLELIQKMEIAYDKKLKLTVLKKIVGMSNIPSIRKAETILTYSPQYTVENGLRKIKDEEEHG